MAMSHHGKALLAGRCTSIRLEYLNRVINDHASGSSFDYVRVGSDTFTVQLAVSELGNVLLVWPSGILTAIIT